MTRARPLHAAALAALLTLGPASRAADAQLVGAVHIATGFLPDPLLLEGRTTGAQPASALGGSECNGFVGTRVNHVLQLGTRFGYLRFFATSDVDLVMAVRTSEGTWLCNDDRFGTHPSVEGLFQRGQVELWIGTAQPGVSADYQLRVTETRSIRPGVGMESTSREAMAMARDLGLEVEAPEGLFTGIRLRRGFMPDPRWLEGEAGGELDASNIGGSCRGFITPRPTHVMTIQSEHDFLQLYLDVDPDDDRSLTLVVLTPDGRFLCDALLRQVPDVTADAWPEGPYRIWVGTLEEGATQRHRLGISEIRRVR